MNTTPNEVSSNGTIFIYISLSVFSATIISYFTPQRFDLFYLYLLIWVGCFSIFFLIFKNKIIKSLHTIRTRIRKSAGWPIPIKILNGICWAAPFILGALIPSMHEYLILAGIGFGNISTYIIFLLSNKIKNIDQLIVGLISIISIGIIIFLYEGKIIDKTYAEFLARILISIAYGIGGIYSAIIKPE